MIYFFDKHNSYFYTLFYIIVYFQFTSSPIIYYNSNSNSGIKRALKRPIVKSRPWPAWPIKPNQNLQPKTCSPSQVVEGSKLEKLAKMEEEKAAAYYDDLTRKGGGAARFKQGLGFSATSDGGNVPARGSALPSFSSSSFLSNFVKASSPSKASEHEKQAQLESIQNKLKKKKTENGTEKKRSPSRDEDRDQAARISRRDDRHSSRRRSRSRERERDRRRRSRSRERYRDKRRRSRSRSDSDGDRRRRERRRSRSSSPRKRRAERRSRSRNSSPRDRRSEKDRKVRKERNGGVDYSRLIEGFDKMVKFVDFYAFD